MPTATMAGMQGDLHRLLEELIKLDYDAIEAYETAIDRLENPTFREHLTAFCEDHRRHTQNLGKFLRDAGKDVPTGPDAKRVLTKGKVFLANLGGDKAILTAMKSNEDDTNAAYERATRHADVPPQVRDILKGNLEDERRHRAWLVQQLERM